MTKNWKDFLTEDGKKHLEFFSNQPLGRFYCPFMGNIQIPEDEWETVKNDALAFIEEYWYEQWSLTFNAESEMWFIFQTED